MEHVHQGEGKRAEEREEVDEGGQQAAVTNRGDFSCHHDQGHVQQSPGVATAQAGNDQGHYIVRCEDQQQGVDGQRAKGDFLKD